MTTWINDRQVLLTLEHDLETDNRTVFMKYVESENKVPVLYFTANCKVFTISKPKVQFGTMRFYKDDWFFNDGKENHKYSIMEKADFLKLEIAELETAKLYIQQNPNLF